ncbi:LysR family transcriptional regulator [Streptomyces sp. N2-109]|uniref:LysR family transcriptional regulator n=1 Tax=Streptomyces gossypii TaxID=2883101 RepID=A0ABT2JT44_9ACTN|nr:LysR substrate-binding domain-containing protein [Streptomyces gossypii]MCT2591045.1 LysR family transcriptional regulator [Streptomyces gossypii]
MLNPWRLRLLTQLESLGTIRAVAEALDMSPSSVSQQLSVLQRESRAVLLEHHGRRVSLTPAGVRLAAHAREILRHIEVAEADLTERRTEPVGEVRVAAFSSALHALVLPVAAQLRQVHPRLQISTTELEPHHSLQALQRGDVDLAVIYDLADGWLPVDDQIRRVTLSSDPVVLVLPQGHPGAEAPSCDLAAMAGERWAMDQPGCYLCELITRLCRKAGFEPVIAGRYASYALLLEHVQAGLAVAALPALAVDARYDVQVRALTPALTRTILAALPAGPPPLPAAQLVLHRLRARGEALRRPTPR